MSDPLRHDRPVPSVSRGAAPLVEALVRDAELLRLGVSRGSLGERLVDAGAKCVGSIEAGLKIAEIGLGGLGKVSLSGNSGLPNWPFAVEVRTSDPVIACLGSQYAGWSLSHSEGETNYFVLGSGPGRAVAAVEELYGELGFRDTADETVLVLEADAPPPAPLVAHVAEQLGLAPDRITFIYAPTWSLAGGTQVVARVLEVALHKAHTLHFPLEHIVDGLAVAPLSPPVPDFVSAMGRTNDAIIYGGRVQLFVKGPDEDAQSLARRLPSHHSSDHGEPFADIFKRFGGDFYKIDPMLFSPAAVIVTNVETGRTFRAGALYPDLIDASFA